MKVGDTVKVIAGSDKGKISEIARVYRHNSKVLVKDVNLKTKHVKGKQEGESGQIIQVCDYINMVICVFITFKSYIRLLFRNIRCLEYIYLPSF